MSKQIRLWKVGYICKENPMNSILPTKVMIEKVKNLIKAVTEEGALDIIWGPDLNIELVYVDEDIENYVLNQDGKLEKV